MDVIPAPVDLTNCDREPIHVPGSIQPYGLMLVAEQDGLQVRHCAGNAEAMLGIDDWQGRSLNQLIGQPLGAKVAAFTETGAAAGYIGQFQGPLGEMLDVSVHPSGRYLLVELEPVSVAEMPASFMLDRLSGASAGFEAAASLVSLCERAAREFRRLTGFDRVMVYRFLPDDAGRVMAEDRRADMHSFLHHHFPASDIPSQARVLYLRNLIRVIVDTQHVPAMLRPAWAEAEPLDMSDSSLRSVSPNHIQYLKNMNVRASASMSIVKDGMLWGMIACHHETPHLLPYDVRAACRSLAGSLGRQIRAKEEAEGYRQRIRLRGFEDEMVALLSREGALDLTLSNHLQDVGRMMMADGVAVLRGRELVSDGVCPDAADIHALAAWLLTRPSQPVYSSNRLSRAYASAGTFAKTASGLLAVTLSADEPWLLLWFRAEQIEVVNWAGNPHKEVRTGEQEALTPRASFDAWEETVRGQARGWMVPEIDAAVRLRAALLEVRQNRQLQELNRQLTKILRDKDSLLQQNVFLIGEVNHRVQNSLQLVSSYLASQARVSDSPEVVAALQEARRRISAVAAVHRRLYRGDQVAFVDASRYIEELCADTFSFMGQDWAQHLTLNLSPVMVSTDRAVTLGLLLTELMINANKYAYAGAAGPIEIELLEDRTQLYLIVADKGVGKLSLAKGFGSRIMDGLVAQLGGKLTYRDNNPGLRSTITIPTRNS